MGENIEPDPGDHDDATRRPLNTMPCQTSIEGWDLFCDMHGVTRTAMIDSIGHLLRAMADQRRLDLRADAESVIVLARRIDAERRRRPKGAGVNGDL